MTTFHFGPFSYDPQTGALHRGDAQQILRKQVNQLLLLLIQQRQKVLSRQDIQIEIWPGEHVEPNNFFQCINHLRKALGEETESPQYFRNYRGKGYQWICPIDEVVSVSKWRCHGLFSGRLWLLATIVSVVSLAFAWIAQNPSLHKETGSPDRIRHFPHGPSLSARAASPIRVAGFFESFGEQNSIEANQNVWDLLTLLDGNTSTKSAVMHDSGSTLSHSMVAKSQVSKTKTRKGRGMKVFARAREAYRRGDVEHCRSLLMQAKVRAQENGDRHAEAQADRALARIGG